STRNVVQTNPEIAVRGIRTPVIESAVATIRSSDPGEMPCHSVGTWHGPTAGEELVRLRTATEADAARRQTSAALRQGVALRLPRRAWRTIKWRHGAAEQLSSRFAIDQRPRKKAC